MECTEEVEAAAVCAEMKDIEEPILTYLHHQPPEEIEQIFIKEENQLETPEDPDTCDPLELERDEVVSEEETISPPDASHVKKEPELQNDVESTSYDSEPESGHPKRKVKRTQRWKRNRGPAENNRVPQVHNRAFKSTAEESQNYQRNDSAHQ
ncbi:uncharacterized protein LOC126106362 isoform X8 [Schistocerca cancellata]|uniref:uncharacterized protein LOC126106362 isoform X8 n=1 Tax=Schistocerca cancellata TaxID=274614 RepID=UPI0021189CD9|nr:uncharacterized protein LOC126106362 isoform X8 [Schistocerca cancellata]